MDTQNNKNQCDNCLKTFKTFWKLERHLVALRPCKKVELDDNGNVIQTKKFTCNDCGELFTLNHNLDRHKRESCKGSVVNNITTNNNNTTNNTNTNSPTTINDNSNNSNNSINIHNSNHNDIGINIGTLNQFIKPKTEFQEIKDKYININNLDKYLVIFRNQSISVNGIIEIIKEILSDNYVNNIPLEERNILTINSDDKLHYYKNEKWNQDYCYDNFQKGCIKKILEQMRDALFNKMRILQKVKDNDIAYFKTYDFSLIDDELNEIVSKKTYNIFYKIDSEVDNLIHEKKLDAKWKIYDGVYEILKSSIIVERVLSKMKEKLKVDNELREIISKIPVSVE